MSTWHNGMWCSVLTWTNHIVIITVASKMIIASRISVIRNVGSFFLPMQFKPDSYEIGLCTKYWIKEHLSSYNFDWCDKMILTVGEWRSVSELTLSPDLGVDYPHISGIILQKCWGALLSIKFLKSCKIHRCKKRTKDRLTDIKFILAQYNDNTVYYTTLHLMWQYQGPFF